MSNLETRPAEMLLSCPADDPPGIEVITSRVVPLGGPRAMPVRRTLPSRERSFVGAWCFADHYGPDDVAATGGMDVAPHPHTGLQTVSWLFTGEVEHRDSAGVHAMVRPGELNLMSSGAGICHSEVSTAGTTVLHGVQLWLVLPREARTGPRGFQHHAPTPVPLPGGSGTVSVFIGELLGEASPVTTATPLLGAELTLPPGAVVDLPVRADFEHGVLLDTGAVEVDDVAIERAELAFRAPCGDTLRLASTGDEPARVILLGGEPFREEIVMWWNFIGADHDEIVAARDAWNGGGDPAGEYTGSELFGRVEGYVGERAWLPAPDLPGVRLRPRRNPNATTVVGRTEQ
ncbi:pirin family protein [Georgenia sp. Z1344]|uniref:pirin family protein n=1 Tax=Georgenia sp. Z1344 TaxID=3416706 RepID=UPI003CEF7D21